MKLTIKNIPSTPIMRECMGYIILAQNERDFKSKANKIIRGDRRGFYLLDEVINLVL